MFHTWAVHKINCWLYQQFRSSRVPHLQHLVVTGCDLPVWACGVYRCRCHNRKGISYCGPKWKQKNMECAVHPVPQAKHGESERTHLTVVNGHAFSVWQRITRIHDLNRHTGVRLIWTGRWRSWLCWPNSSVWKTSKTFLLYTSGAVCPSDLLSSGVVCVSSSYII